MIVDSETLQFAFMCALLAGLTTGIGGAIVFFVKPSNHKVLTFTLGFSAGVMIYISFVELLHMGRMGLTNAYGLTTGGWLTLCAFVGGMGIAALIDKVVPADENPHEALSMEDIEESQQGIAHSGEFSAAKVKRSGFLFALAITLHNFPEGMATVTSAIDSTTFGLAVTFAVALHNIPEGMAVAIPLYYGTGSKKKAFWYSLLTGLAEPVGAGIAILVLLPFLTPALMAALYASVAGIMVYIAFDELLPMAERWGHHHLSLYGIVAGMVLMACILI